MTLPNLVGNLTYWEVVLMNEAVTYVPRSRGMLNIPGDRPSGIFSRQLANELIHEHGYSIGKQAVVVTKNELTDVFPDLEVVQVVEPDQVQRIDGRERVTGIATTAGYFSCDTIIFDLGDIEFGHVANPHEV